MFTIDELWKTESLSPLKKVYEENERDSRLVVVINKDGSVNTKETINLHMFLEKQMYFSIPVQWVTDTDDYLDIVHVSKLMITMLRRNPFGNIIEPLLPNSWLNKLPMNRFYCLLLSQELGHINMSPSKEKIIDDIKPKLTANDLSSFWEEMEENVKFAQSGQPPHNDNQKRILLAWTKANERCFFDPTLAPNIHKNHYHKEYEIVEIDWGNNSWSAMMTLLRTKLISNYQSIEDICILADEVFGNTNNIDLNGTLINVAHNMVSYAKRIGKLNHLAAHVEFNPNSNNSFNQTGQQVRTQINIGNVRNSKISVGSVNVGGDFVGRDKIVIHNDK